MQINQEELEDFRKQYKGVFGVELSLAEASEAANNLADLYLFLVRIPLKMTDDSGRR